MKRLTRKRAKPGTEKRHESYLEIIFATATGPAFLLRSVKCSQRQQSSVVAELPNRHARLLAILSTQFTSDTSQMVPESMLGWVGTHSLCQMTVLDATTIRKYIVAIRRVLNAALPKSELWIESRRGVGYRLTREVRLRTRGNASTNVVIH